VLRINAERFGNLICLFEANPEDLGKKVRVVLDGPYNISLITEMTEDLDCIRNRKPQTAKR
jgi:hypothetical protein